MLLFVIWSILKLIEFWPSGLDFLKSGVWKDLGHPEKNCLGLLCEIVHFIVKQYTHVIPLETQRTQTLELVGGVLGVNTVHVEREVWRGRSRSSLVGRVQQHVFREVAHYPEALRLHISLPGPYLTTLDALHVDEYYSNMPLKIFNKSRFSQFEMGKLQIVMSCWNFPRYWGNK